MKNSNVIKFATLALSIAIMAAPMVAGAQVRSVCSSAGGTGLLCTFGGANTISGLILAVINIILALAGLIAVLVLIIGGFRYVTSFGNEEVTGQAKKMILNAILGIIIIILAFVIVQVVQNLFLHPQNI
ncbi:MAG: hypothetical protein KW788_03185 [Candidatus Doudnabacteria bacterium]|nr:hypothetical protein [Candidatus Doudnabacteria bacterium]